MLNLEETFQYDELNRLTEQSVTGSTTVNASYDAAGNITNKSDVGLYDYDGFDAGPHAVTTAGGTTYEYDDNGNNTSSSDGRVITYTTFSKPSLISKGGHATSFEYGPDRGRFKRTDTGSGGLEVTRYVGNVEIVDRPDGTHERKRYIAGIAIETHYFGTNTVEDYRTTIYEYRDHLGSVDAITDDQGVSLQDLSFDAWGQRRDSVNWTALTEAELIAFSNDLTKRGFTDHEMLDEVGVIHMNGRIYDPKIGRFLQADPFVQDPTNTQSLNRYSYVLNNPLNATDPSGYFLSLLVGAILAIKGTVDIAVIVSWMAAAAFADALIAGGDFMDALIAGISAAAFGGMGADFASLGGGFGATSAKVMAFGTLGGVTSLLQGGKFGDGFKSAGISTISGALAGGVSSKLKLGTTGQSVTRIVAAGTASELTGGKFANGALGEAFMAAARSVDHPGAMEVVSQSTIECNSRSDCRRKFNDHYEDNGVAEERLSRQERREVINRYNEQKAMIDIAATVNHEAETLAIWLVADENLGQYGQFIGRPGDNPSRMLIPPTAKMDGRSTVVVHFHPNVNDLGTQLWPSAADLQYSINNNAIMITVNPRNTDQLRIFRGVNDE